MMVSWTDRVTNREVQNHVYKKMTSQSSIRKGWDRMIGHILRHGWPWITEGRETAVDWDMHLLTDSDWRIYERNRKVKDVVED